MMKKCSKCKIEKDFNEFYKDSRKKDGLRCWCKECQKEDNRKRESLYNETRKLYRINNPDKFAKQKRDYYKNNKDQILSNNKEWRQTFLGRYSSYVMGAKNRNIKWNLTKKEVKIFWKNSNCTYCGDFIDGLGLDRIDSNKDYSIDNITPCCTICNRMKLDLDKETFINKIKQIIKYLDDKRTERK